jgi:glycosyltransferase involved in cell wall biosynthesis
MKIALIGPGIMQIPPPGWGAVEILIWDYYLELKRNNIDVDIINPIRSDHFQQSNPNTEYCRKLIKTINDGKYDFVHLHYDCLYHIVPFLDCEKIGITSHYPYIDDFERHYMDGYNNIFNFISNNVNHHIFALSVKDYNMFHDYSYDKNKVWLILNGSNHNDIFTIENIDEKLYSNKSIYLGKIEPRKKQEVYCKIPDVDFYGKCDTNFKYNSFYKGEPPRDELMNVLKHYGNLVLLSDGENGTPLVIKEALMAGLPIVTNNYSSNDLDTSLPFIDIIPDDKLDDLDYIENIIKENRKKQYLHKEIREYAISNFSWKLLVEKYIEMIKKLE